MAESHSSFSSLKENVNSIVQQQIERVLQPATYNAKEVQGWTTAVSDGILAELQNVDRTFKYVVSCVIMQKTGAGLHSSTTCLWDKNTDGSCTVRWENKSMHCIVTVFGLGL
eukprot:GILJ01008553.1.p1 GENE.GILJ01008553.1~~GILJ01008553.1.p1  ORF type:complete len:112 (-),score=5.91 GILJ01008553.1:55-390(-)